MTNINISFKNLIPSIIGIAIFLLAWVDYGVEVKDPWYKELDKVNEALTIRKENPEKAKQLLDEAGEGLKALTEKHPYHAKLRMLYGYYAMNVGNLDLALEELKIAIDKGKGGIVNQIEYQAGDMLTNVVINKTNKMFKKAKKTNNKSILEEANNFLINHLEYANHNANYHYQLGLSYQNLNDLENTVKHYNEALKRNPKHENANRNMAALNFYLGNKSVEAKDFENAYRYYKSAQKIIPNHPDYNNNLGNVCLKLEKYQEAVNYFKNAVKFNSNSRVFKGNLEIAQKKLKKQKSNAQ